MSVLFVYGSLKRGQANHWALAGAEFVGLARTALAFALREIEGFPALVPGELSIAGELYRVSPQGLAALDEFEGPDYARGELTLADGGTALAYLACAPESGRPLAGSEWPTPPSQG